MNEKENNQEQFPELDVQMYLFMQEVDKLLLSGVRRTYRENNVNDEYCGLGVTFDVAPDDPIVNEYIARALDPPESVTISAWGPYSLDGNDQSSPNQNLTTALYMKSGELEREYLFQFRTDEQRGILVQKDERRVYGVREYDNIGENIIDGSALIEELASESKITKEELELLYKTVVGILKQSQDHLPY